MSTRLGQILQAHPSTATALLFEDETYSYGALEALSNRLASRLLSLGLAPGQTVTFLTGNDPVLVAGFVACFKAGLVANPLHDRLTADEIRYIVGHAGSAAIVVSEPHAATLADALAGLDAEPKTVCFGEPGPLTRAAAPDLEAQSDTAVDVARSPDDMALLLYTSGTTGRPKGVALTRRNVFEGVYAVSLGFELKPSDRTFCFMSLSHTNALMFSTLPFLMAGGSIALARRFSASTFWDQCARYEVNSASASPTILSILLESDEPARAHGLDFVKVASAPTSIDLARRFEEKFGAGLLLETYGLTETTSINVMNPLRGARKHGSIGKPLSPCEVRVVDAEGRIVSGEEVGEIMISGPTVMQGYFKDPSATAETIRDGWVRSGDLARIDDEGYVFIVGRRKEVIIRGGENISPLEVEQAISRHPAVLEAAAVGIPDRIYGETVAACVVRRASATVSEAEIVAFCKQQLASFKVPARIVFVEELPRNPIGKFIRRALLPHFERQDPSETRKSA